MEKPVAVDPVGIRSVITYCKKSCSYRTYVLLPEHRGVIRKIILKHINR